jgi:hypothetical protein
MTFPATYEDDAKSIAREQEQREQEQEDKAVAIKVAAYPREQLKIAEYILLLLRTPNAIMSNIEISQDDMRFCHFQVANFPQKAMEHAYYILALLEFETAHLVGLINENLVQSRLRRH